MKTKILFVVFCFGFLSLKAQTKDDYGKSVYLGLAPLSLLQGNIKLEPGYNYSNFRLSFPINIYCFRESTSRWTNSAALKGQIGSNLSRSQNGDKLNGFGIGVRPVFFVNSSGATKDQQDKLGFISFSLAYHRINVQPDGLGYVEQHTSDGKLFYDYGHSLYPLKASMLSLRFEAGKEWSIFESYRLSVYGGIAYNLHLNPADFARIYSKTRSLSSVYYNKTPMPAIGVQFGRNFFRKKN